MKKLHNAHLTGTADIIHNHGLSDTVRLNEYPSYNMRQMFFKPYKSKEEFMFCVRNTLQPAAILAVMSSLVFSAPIGGALMCGFAIAGCVLLGGVEDPSLSINLAEEIATRTLQAAINLILFPVTLITLITRSISTIASFTMGEDEPSMPEEPKIIPELRLIPCSHNV